MVDNMITAYFYDSCAGTLVTEQRSDAPIKIVRDGLDWSYVMERLIGGLNMALYRPDIPGGDLVRLSDYPIGPTIGTSAEVEAYLKLGLVPV